jgi:hypothetical protein
VLDVDGGEPHAVARELANYTSIIHSTYKHSPSSPRCRVIFLLAHLWRDIQGYNRVEKFLAETLTKAGLFCPPSDSTLGRLAFLPMHAPGVEPVYLRTYGQLLDLEELLKRLPPEPSQKWKSKPSESGASGAALSWARRTIENAPFGRRHTNLFAVAAWLAEKTSATDTEILTTCLDAALSVAVEGSAARHKKEKCIRDAIDRGRAHGH